MSIVTKYLLADEEEKKRQREGYMDVLRNTHTAGMLSGGKDILSKGWDTIKGFGEHLAENNPVSLRFDEVRANVDAYDAYWLKRLQHPGAPTKEDYGNEVDFDNDYRKYWDERPLDYDWFK